MLPRNDLALSSHVLRRIIEGLILGNFLRVTHGLPQHRCLWLMYVLRFILYFGGFLIVFLHGC